MECLGGNVPIDPKRLSAFRTLEAANALWDEGLASIEVPPQTNERPGPATRAFYTNAGSPITIVTPI